MGPHPIENREARLLEQQCLQTFPIPGDRGPEEVGSMAGRVGTRLGQTIGQDGHVEYPALKYSMRSRVP